MSRERYKVTKRISPENTAAENHRLAQFGELWGTDEFTQAWHWRFMLALCDGPDLPKTKVAMAKRRKGEIVREIGEALAEAIAKGHSDYFRRLAVAVEFVNDRIDWNVKIPQDLIRIYAFHPSKFTPVDALREAIAREYFMVKGGPVEEARKSRKTFMDYIAKILNEENDHEERGKFSKRFDNAVKAMGITFRKKVDNS